jgi:hypothetical protein
MRGIGSAVVALGNKSCLCSRIEAIKLYGSVSKHYAESTCLSSEPSHQQGTINRVSPRSLIAFRLISE